MSLQISDHADRIQAQLDRDIDDLKLFQHSFLSRRNAFAPVYVLPPEVLAHCFRFISLKQLIKGAVDHSLDVRLRKQLIAYPTVTAVCRYWRQVALEEPCL